MIGAMNVFFTFVSYKKPTAFAMLSNRMQKLLEWRVGGDRATICRE